MGIWNRISAGVWDHSGQDVESVPDFSRPIPQQNGRYFRTSIVIIKDVLSHFSSFVLYTNYKSQFH